MKTWEEIEGFYDWGVYYEQVVEDYTGGVLVEVGAYLGRSLCHLGKLVKESGKPFTVIGVETGLGSGLECTSRETISPHANAVREGGGTFIGQLHKNIVDCGLVDVISLVVAPSVKAATFFPDRSLTMCFIDAAHDYPNVTADIRAWLSKVKLGGELAGDDVGVPNEVTPVWPDVRRALDDTLPGWVYQPHDAWKYRLGTCHVPAT